jgi:hypothetical protein
LQAEAAPKRRKKKEEEDSVQEEEEDNEQEYSIQEGEEANEQEYSDEEESSTRYEMSKEEWIADNKGRVEPSCARVAVKGSDKETITAGTVMWLASWRRNPKGIYLAICTNYYHNLYEY